MTAFQDLPFSIRILLDEAGESQNKTATTLYRCIQPLIKMASDRAIADSCKVSESLVAMIRETQVEKGVTA